MAHQIIPQPNGKFSVYSTTIDRFVIHGVSAEAIIEQAARDAAEAARNSTIRILDEILKGNKPYYQFTVGWEEAVKKHNTNSPDWPVSF